MPDPIIEQPTTGTTATLEPPVNVGSTPPPVSPPVSSWENTPLSTPATTANPVESVISTPPPVSPEAPTMTISTEQPTAAAPAPTIEAAPAGPQVITTTEPQAVRSQSAAQVDQENAFKSFASGASINSQVPFVDTAELNGQKGWFAKDLPPQPDTAPSTPQTTTQNTSAPAPSVETPVQAPQKPWWRKLF